MVYPIQAKNRRLFSRASSPLIHILRMARVHLDVKSYFQIYPIHIKEDIAVPLFDVNPAINQV